jgi:cytochrome c biogenesis factor
VAVEAWRGGASAGIIAAERRQYLDGAQRPVSEPAMKPGIRSFLWLDLYVLLAELRGDLAQLRVSFRPLVSLVWLGWALVFAGAVGVTAQLTVRDRSRPHGVGTAAA